jgi:hypothetical protein
LNDWNSGKLRYYTEPPIQEEKMDESEGNSQILSTQLVAEFSKEFDLDALDQDIRVIIDGGFSSFYFIPERIVLIFFPERIVLIFFPERIVLIFISERIVLIFIPERIVLIFIPERIVLIFILE